MAQAAERALSFFLMPVLAKAINPAEYAIWAQSVVTAGVLTPVVLLGFQTALVKYLPQWESNPEVRDSVLLAMLATILGMLAVVGVAVTLFGSAAAGLVYGGSDHVSYVLLLAGLLASEALFEFLVGILRASNRIRVIAAYILLKGGWRIAAFMAMLYWADADFRHAFTVFVFIQLLFVGLMYAKDISLTRIVKTGFAAGRHQWGKILSFSLPLVALAVMTGLNNFSDRFFLAYLRSLNEVASYSAVYSLAAMASFFFSVLGFTLFPALSTRWADGRQAEVPALFARVLQGYLFFILPFIAGLAVTGPALLLLLTTEAYAAPRAVFFLLGSSIGLFGLYQLGFYVVLLGRGSASSLGLMGLATGVNVLLNAVLVPGFGVTGAALAGCVSNAVLAGLTIRMARQILVWHFPWASAARITLRTAVLAGVLLLGDAWVGFAGTYNLFGMILLSVCIYFGLDLLDRRASTIFLLK